MEKIAYAVGYNRTGQEFFDYIESKVFDHYYFCPNRTFEKVHSPDEEYAVLKNIKTTIHGTVALNNRECTASVFEKFYRLQNLNIDSAVVMDQRTADEIKKISSSIKIHVSICAKIMSFEDFLSRFNAKTIYCVNVRNIDIFNFTLMDKLHGEGIKVKVIPNEWCVWNRDEWFRYMIGKDVCGGIKRYCFGTCGEVIDSLKMRWLNLTRQGFTPDFVPYLEGKVDIIKLTTRRLSMEHLKNEVEPWVWGRSDSIPVTRFYSNSLFNLKLVKPLPEEYILKKMSCDHRCKECLYCKKVYYTHTEEGRKML